MEDGRHHTPMWFLRIFRQDNTRSTELILEHGILHQVIGLRLNIVLYVLCMAALIFSSMFLVKRSYRSLFQFKKYFTAVLPDRDKWIKESQVWPHICNETCYTKGFLIHEYWPIFVKQTSLPFPFTALAKFYFICKCWRLPQHIWLYT